VGILAVFFKRTRQVGRVYSNCSKNGRNQNRNVKFGGVFFVFIPNLIQTFRFSISDIDAANGFKLTLKGFSYYIEALTTDPEFIPKLVSNLQGLLVRIPVILIYSLFISMILNQKFKGRGIARIIFFVPVIVAAGVIAAVDGNALNRSGVGQIVDTGAAANMSGLLDVSKLLQNLNLPKPLISVVTMSIMQIYDIARSSGLQIFIFLAGLQEIPESLYEAASIEG
jgi:ABC-type sugar transport system permease subunit